MNRIIPQELAQVLLDYLAARPYIEVHKIIEQILKLELIKEEDAK